ncbi:MAG: hypothetical protein HXS41_01870 [Theionarchaea archaeon]|nr:hypothetical protein [Theionarchaea archaeon]MBU7001972.1 hypothetical protein [Theionarchaea archaeon]MBU7019777.1 hypothetical protein [Theionarchaea archaeon]MBU7034603.1 hypothetical protein [Theionarchaea archaeon]MBU7041307.1 hypothetical protein [Theionarchaea archaeon]
MNPKYCLLTTVVILCGCISQSPHLEFSAGPCDSDIDPYNTDMGVKNVRWIDDETLVVTVYVNINCAEEITDGDYQILGDTIILEYTAPECKTCTFCLCAHKMTYRFQNLEKKEYQFELKKET